MRNLDPLLRRWEGTMIDHQIAHAVRQARMAGAGQFARTLVRHLPGTRTHLWVDLSLLRDDELALLSEERA